MNHEVKQSDTQALLHPIAFKGPAPHSKVMTSLAGLLCENDKNNV